MKKVLYTLTLTMIISFLPAENTFAGAKADKNDKIELTQEEVDKKVKRIHEIKAMDFKSLSRKERRSLKKEVVQIKKDLAVAEGGNNGGIYLSTTAVVVIIIVLIILL